MSRTAVGVRAASRLMIPGSVSISCWKMRTPASRNDFLSKCGGLPCEFEEGFRRVRTRVVLRDRNAGRGRFAELDPLADDGVEHVVVAEILQRVEHFAREDGAAVVERRQDADHAQLRIQS